MCGARCVLCGAASWVRPSSEPPVEGIFSLELTRVQIPFPKTLSDGSINGGLVCTHMHAIALTWKILIFINFMSLTSECWQQHTQHAKSTKTECDYLYGPSNLRNVHIRKNLTKMVNSKDIAGNAEKEEENVQMIHVRHTPHRTSLHHRPCIINHRKCLGKFRPLHKRMTAQDLVFYEPWDLE